MAPFYEEVCKNLDWPVDEALLSTMKAHNAEQLKKLDDTIEDAEKNLSEMEVREANLKKSEYLCRIGDKEGAISAFRKTYDKTVSLGHRLDIVFHNIRIGLFYLDHDHITRNIEKAKWSVKIKKDFVYYNFIIINVLFALKFDRRRWRLGQEKSFKGLSRNILHSSSQFQRSCKLFFGYD